MNLAKIENLQFTEPMDKKGFIKTVKNNNQIFIYLLDVIDIEAEIKRISFEITKLNTEVAKSNNKLSNPQFIEKAPGKIIEKEQLKLNKAIEELRVLKEQLAFFNKG